MKPAAARLALAALLLGPVVPLHAQEAAPPQLGSCRGIAADTERLACYDRLAGRVPATAAGATGPVPAVPAGRTPAIVGVPEEPVGPGLQGPPAPRPSFLSSYWELDEADKRGVFNFTGYRPNFVLPMHVTTRINNTPDSPAADRSGSLGDYRKVEAKVQISLRTKLAENLLLPGGDLWAGYTQQSLWQVYRPSESSPFRSTDYEPELMYVLPTPQALRTLPGGWQWRYGILALAHQSNGQNEPLSRSWNRLYMGGGFERDDVSLSVRYNYRFGESASKDDNPDLVDYRGHTDWLLAWTPGRTTASMQWSTSFRRWDRGSLQFDWTYPVEPDNARALRWYVQLFSGYAETLLDYNFRQTSLGVGLTLFEF
ncbi:phospholipase A [Methylibium sp.]|uniref:phospholipase A n=1 Tax=Methylibium sp. TaxID=2067992 RepID=UPI0025EC8727|nr:phospholipase A [Methylibium sp.]